MNKFGVVTGASTGIGQSIAVALSKKGYSLALIARNVNGLEETKSLIEKEKGQAKIFPTDLSNVSKINELISTIKAETNQLNILVNVAGVWHDEKEVYAGKNFEEFPQEVILNTYSVGITAPTLLTHGFLPIMGSGSKIINISGTFESGAKGWLPYYVSKRAIEDLTVGLAEELKDKGVTVNCISPSDTATQSYRKFYPQYIKDSINPEEIAKFVTKLCSEETTGKGFVLKKDKEPFEGFHS
jgi:NAD(P)-dependent dehydrogenase (short-subunit alcohol dehydrogenase family)